MSHCSGDLLECLLRLYSIGCSADDAGGRLHGPHLLRWHLRAVHRNDVVLSSFAQEWRGAWVHEPRRFCLIITGKGHHGVLRHRIQLAPVHLPRRAVGLLLAKRSMV